MSKPIDNRVIRRVNYFNSLLEFAAQTEDKAWQIHLRENVDDDIIIPIGEIMSACKKLQDGNMCAWYTGEPMPADLNSWLNDDHSTLGSGQAGTFAQVMKDLFDAN